MCLIVDNDVAARVFLDDADPKFHRLHKAIRDGRRGVVVHYGGKNRDELVRNGRVRAFLQVLLQSGGAVAVPDIEVAAHLTTVEGGGECESNDAHVIALALAGGARLLATEDVELMSDFKNRRVIGPRRGSIYARDAHDTLLARRCVDRDRRA